jgi:hypothetical protein
MLRYNLRSVNAWLDSTKKFDVQKKRYRNANKLRAGIAVKLRAVYDVKTLGERVLALEELIFSCDFIIKKLDSKKSENEAYILVNTIKLQAEAMSLLKTILDVRSNKELEIKLEANREYLNNNKGVVTQNFSSVAKESKLIKLDSYYDEENYAVKYLSKPEREEKRVIISDGCFKQIVRSRNKNPDDHSLSIQPFSSESCLDSESVGPATIVVDKRGNMFVGSTIPGLYHHSSPVAGKPVYFAGLIRTNVNGELEEIGNRSGHYKPTEYNTSNFLKHLGRKGALDYRTDISITKGHYLPLFFPTSIKHNIDISDIQHKLLHKEIKGSTLMSYRQWLSESSGSFFSIRYSILKDIDALLLMYFKKFNILRPEENIELINKIFLKIKEQQETHPNSSRKEAILNLKKQLQNEEKIWKSDNRQVTRPSVSGSNIS